MLQLVPADAEVLAFPQLPFTECEESEGLFMLALGAPYNATHFELVPRPGRQGNRGPSWRAA